MIDFDNVKKTFIGWAILNSGITETGRHYWKNQSSPAPPDSPKVALSILTGPIQIGNNDPLLYDKSTDTFNVSGVRNLVIEVNVYGSDALKIASNLSISIQRPDVQQFFRAQNISVGASQPNVINISELLDTIFEERRMFELNVMVAYINETNLGESIGSIDKVIAEGVGEMKQGKDNKIIIGG